MTGFDFASFVVGGAVASTLFLAIEVLADWLYGRRPPRRGP